MKCFGFLLSIIPVLGYANLQVCDLLFVEHNEPNYKIEQVAETTALDFEFYFEDELTKALDLFENDAIDQEDLFSVLEKNAREDELSSTSLPDPRSAVDTQAYLHEQKSETALQPSVESVPSQMKRARAAYKNQHKMQKKVAQVPKNLND